MSVKSIWSEPSFVFSFWSLLIIGIFQGISFHTSYVVSSCKADVTSYDYYLTPTFCHSIMDGKITENNIFLIPFIYIVLNFVNAVIAIYYSVLWIISMIPTFIVMFTIFITLPNVYNHFKDTNLSIKISNEILFHLVLLLVCIIYYGVQCKISSIIDDCKEYEMLHDRPNFKLVHCKYVDLEGLDDKNVLSTLALYYGSIFIGYCISFYDLMIWGVTKVPSLIIGYFVFVVTPRILTE